MRTAHTDKNLSTPIIHPSLAPFSLPNTHHGRDKTVQHNRHQKKKKISFCSKKTCVVLQHSTHQQRLVVSAIETKETAQLLGSKSSPFVRPYLQITGGVTLDNKGSQRFNAVPLFRRLLFFSCTASNLQNGSQAQRATCSLKKKYA